MPNSLKGKRVTVVGLGRFAGGVGATRWLCSQGAQVTVSDKAVADDLAESIAKLDGLDVTLHLGGHLADDFLSADLLVVSPAVPAGIGPLLAADAAGVPRTTEINLFIERCPAPIIGITGTAGKSTTTAMTGEILSQVRTCHVGGNIGVSLLEELDDITADDIVVLELSSFQLDQLGQIAISPSVALVTNLSPNHLDRHGDFASYRKAKSNIFRYQSADDVLILNSACEALADLADQAPGRVEFFDPCGGGREDEPFELAVPGTHNQANAQAAWAIAKQFAVPHEIASDVLSQFTGLPHRLEFVCERDRVRYFNDSKCTTPEGAIVALDAFEPRTAVMIVGGYDKGSPFEELALALVSRAKVVVTIGATAGAIASAVAAAGDGSLTLLTADDLTRAVSLARSAADAGDAVVLSPACASYDMFTNYEHRGKEFVELVRR